MAQAMKRLPIDASAKCSGTRSGVSMTSVSSDVITAAMLILTKIAEHDINSFGVELVLFDQDARRQTLGRITVTDRHLALRDDGPAVQRLINKMYGAPADLCAMRQGLLLRVETGKRRQQTWMNI